jgi:hypothetical protein
VRARICPSHSADAFALSANRDGNCELRTQVALDRESIGQYLLNITVSALGFSDFAQVTIVVLDVNDNRPVFVYVSGAVSLFDDAKYRYSTNNDLGFDVFFGGISSTADALQSIMTIKVGAPTV